MCSAIVYSRAQSGIEATPVQVEVHLESGIPRFTLVGLPRMAVRESKDRVRAALINAKFAFPQHRITVNLAPADLPKEGGRFDLAIALGILAASGQLPAAGLAGQEFYGELSLHGELRPFRGALPAALQARRAGRAVIVPVDNGGEACLVENARVHTAAHLLEVCSHVRGHTALPRASAAGEGQPLPPSPDLSEVRDQAHAKRTLEIAAAGGHSLLMIGPPGTGKSMLATRLPGLLPQMSEEEALETAAVHSVSGLGLDPSRWRLRPFRAPHHTASAVALVGGGSLLRPGEISLAHNGVLFLDELTEFDRRVLESLREPLESGQVLIARAGRHARFPARFQLVAAMNPCPCGYLGESRCRCTERQVARYRSRLSGPLLDRIDLQVQVPRPRADTLAGRAPEVEPSAVVARRVLQVRERQQARGSLNADLLPGQTERCCRLGSEARVLLQRAMERLGLSARAYHRVLRVARSIADLAGSEAIEVAHVGEAVGLRSLDRQRG